MSSKSKSKSKLKPKLEPKRHVASRKPKATKQKIAKRRSQAARRPKAAKSQQGKAAASTLDQFFGGSAVIEKEGARIRVLVGKAGLDGHDRGAKVIARAFRDAGFEVVYTGLHQTAEMIVNTAIQEDVDVLGISILSGAHNYLIPEIAAGLKKQGVALGKDMLLVVGGIIPESDFEFLRKQGVSMVFTPGSSVEAIVDYVRAHVKPKA